ncbi:hypothetical protein LCM4573_27010 [Rhizobium sp. LCM 4573]|nr:hypothetical protein [Rhizobium sp. LCM 4573]OHV78224.1 hypothetical protein LCM4573_27010 [Rhizobium sp. LCM 4573]
MAAAPKWRFEYNLNTIVILLGFAGGFVAWGATWNQVQTETRANSAAIERLDKRLTVAAVATVFHPVGVPLLMTGEFLLSVSNCHS